MKVVLECANFMEAFQMCFGLCFLFNLEYPREASCSLEFVQRYYMKIHPDAGSKSKKNSLSKKKL